MEMALTYATNTQSKMAPVPGSDLTGTNNAGAQQQTSPEESVFAGMIQKKLQPVALQPEKQKVESSLEPEGKGAGQDVKSEEPGNVMMSVDELLMQWLPLGQVITGMPQQQLTGDTSALSKSSLKAAITGITRLVAMDASAQTSSTAGVTNAQTAAMTPGAIPVKLLVGEQNNLQAMIIPQTVSKQAETTVAFQQAGAKFLGGEQQQGQEADAFPVILQEAQPELLVQKGENSSNSLGTAAGGKATSTLALVDNLLQHSVLQVPEAVAIEGQNSQAISTAPDSLALAGSEQKDSGNLLPHAQMTKVAVPATETGANATDSGKQGTVLSASDMPQPERKGTATDALRPSQEKPALHATREGGMYGVKATEPATVKNSDKPLEMAVAAGDEVKVNEGAPGKELFSGNNSNGSEQHGKDMFTQISPVLAGTAKSADSPELQTAVKVETPRSPLHESILSQVKEGMVTHDAQGNSQITVRLNPAELGELKIQVRMEDQRVKIEVMSDNRMVKDLLMSNLDSLKETLQKQNLTMGGFTVSTGGGHGFNQAFRDDKGMPKSQILGQFSESTDSSHEEIGKTVRYVTGKGNSSLLDMRF